MIGLLLLLIARSSSSIVMRMFMLILFSLLYSMLLLLATHGLLSVMMKPVMLSEKATGLNFTVSSEEKMKRRKAH